MNILGLDISTTTVGATLLNDKGKIIFCESWDLRKIEKCLFIKADVIKAELIKISQPIDKIIIEQPLQRFIAGRSSIKTILMLAKFNAILSYTCYELFGETPEYVSANSARKKCGIVIEKGADVKEAVLQHILNSEPNFDVQYTRHGNPIHGTYDRADSLVVARVGHITWTQKNSKS